MLKLWLLFVVTVLVSIFSFLSGNAVGRFNAYLYGNPAQDRAEREAKVNAGAGLFFVALWLAVAVVMP